MFRFTIREIVLLTIVVALGVGWWLDHRKLAAINRLLHATSERAVADAKAAMASAEHSNRTFQEIVGRLQKQSVATDVPAQLPDKR